ncbi:MAG: phytanoyl-CoA dioxygenase family protein [Terracidiphilus sp.]
MRIAAPTSAEHLQIPHLERYWRRMTSGASAPKTGEDGGEWDLDNTLLAGLHINLREAATFINQPPTPTLEAFEAWVLGVNGGAIDEPRLRRLRDALAGKPVGSPAGCLDGVPGLTAGDLAHWEEHGYVVVHDAVDPAMREAAAAAIYSFLRASPRDAESWYGKLDAATIWVPLYRHPALEANRRAPQVVRAFADLWGSEDLWAVVDQAGFNPPERSGWQFPGPHIHWDMTLAPPHVFGLQGILYLTDTPAEQGAFCCIPGFQRRLAAWLESLPAGQDPRQAIRGEHGLTPIPGRAGDLVIWHHALPHSSSPNRGKLPRVVQYMTLRPTRWPYTPEWV